MFILVGEIYYAVHDTTKAIRTMVGESVEGVCFPCAFTQDSVQKARRSNGHSRAASRAVLPPASTEGLPQR
jgi:hypothetical protein